MHTIFISACEKRALKKTRAVLDSYAIRTGQTSWAAPMTMEGLNEIRTALKKTATRQTSIAAYINDGKRRMKLCWIVGSRHRFAADGSFPIGSKGKINQQLLIPDWIRSASLLAGAAGDVHDIGKASVHFQHKLQPEQAAARIADPVRHEWLSLKLLQKLRLNGWDWQQAWLGMDRKIDQLTLGQRHIDHMETSLQDALEAVDYLVVTHHKLLASSGDYADAYPCEDNHVRAEKLPATAQFQCAGDLPDSIFNSHQTRMTRLLKQTDNIQPAQQYLFWKALSLHARAALIFADHTISAQTYPNSQQKTFCLYANTKLIDKQRVQDQPLEWHLQQVGDRAARIAVQLHSDLQLTGLCEQTVEHISRPASKERFYWQNKAAQALAKLATKHPDTPSLILNIAGTGSGKTRMNLRAACTLRPHNPRIAIALNLRSLTLQTGDALKQAMNLSDDELATIIGDQVSQQLFTASRTVQFVDEDENEAEPQFDALGEATELPDWLNGLFTRTYKGKTLIDQRAKTILSAPLLVSTIDYLIAAGEPQQQGHHVKALLRVISSDLIVDEIDSYDPKALMAVLRLVQLTAMYGRHVICSSATVSATVASKIHRAFASGIEMRAALFKTPQTSLVGVIDHLIAPKIWLEHSSTPSPFQQHYQTHLDQLQTELAQQPTYRLAQLQPVLLDQLNAEGRILAWQNAVLEAVKQLHQQHAWQFDQTDKRLSIGLVRVANIKPAIQLAHFLATHLPHAKIACYHANDWLIERHHKEQRLDFLLTRHREPRLRKTGNEHLFADAELRQWVAASSSAEIPLIVIATPVEEVGRDHDFDWGVIDASSIQSIVQTAGRINRHRLTPVSVPNVAILQFNHRYCANSENKKKTVFKWPGYEGTNTKKPYYPSQDLKQLLPWDDHGQLVINATLRFNQQWCKLADYDDQQIQSFCEMYFDDHSITQLFSNAQVEPCILAEKPYTSTPLREGQKKEDYYFKLDEDGQFYSYQLLPQFNGYGRISLQENHKTMRQLPMLPNAWLCLSPAQMVAHSEDLGISAQEGCHASLAVYSDHVEWTYDASFGIYRA